MSDATRTTETLSTERLADDNEMGARTKAFDWSTTSLGPITGWPQSLKTIVRTILDSRYAMWLGWGPDFTFFYNDAYAKMTLGPKHPWALGRSAREVWAEIWSVIGPRAESVIQTGRATWDEGLLLFLERNGFPEETYHTFSYSPVPDDAGGIGGMLCVVVEDTERTIGERRLRTLRELAARTSDESTSVEAACQSAAEILSGNPKDVPFAIFYLLDANADRAVLAGTVGVARDQTASPAMIRLSDHNAPWPFDEVARTGKSIVVDDLPQRFGKLPGGPWPESPQRAIVLPMAKPGQSKLAGFVIAGVSARRPFNDDYRGFFDLMVGQIATAVASARVYEEERRRAEALAQLDLAKTAFFSNVSHEFRTPLTLMLGPVEDLLARSHTDLAPAAAGQLELVHRNGLRLLRLVNTLLDFSRIEAGRIRAIYEPTDLPNFTADLASNFRSACDRAGLALIVDCPPLEEPVYVDREMWEKIVLNLLSNAFKFTFEGEITVSLAQRDNAVELRVRDTGTGIPAEEMPRLFERFHRIENAKGRTHEGSGIGLALVHELVRLHGGTVTAESTAGEGTQFIVSVPRGRLHLPADQIGERPAAISPSSGANPFVEEALRWLPDERQVKASRHENASEAAATHCLVSVGEHLERPRVLVADDNADMRQYITKLLAEQFQVAAVADGAAALVAAREHAPDLVLTDIMMPRLNGFELLQELRNDPRLSGLPIIMLSARAGEESRVEGMQAGADDYLVKPFSARELLARVTAHLQIARLRKESERAVRESEERFRALVNATSDVIYRMSPDWSEMWHLEGQQFISDTRQPTRNWLQKYIHPDDQTHVLQVVQQAVEGRLPFKLEHRIIRADGTMGWTSSRAIPLLDLDGNILEWFGAASDVTPRKEAENKLRDSEERLRVTLASIGDAVITTDSFRRVTFLNGVAELLTGWTNLDAQGQPLEHVFRIINEDTREPVASPAGRALDKGIVVGLANHTLLISRDGSERPIDDSAAPVRDRDGCVVGCVLVFRDVTERRLREKQTLEQAQAAGKLAAIVDSSEDAIISKTLNGIIQSWNAAAERIFGYTAAEALGHPITMLFPEDLREEEEGIISRIRSGERLQHFDTVRRRKDGNLIPVSLTISPIKDPEGRIVGASKIARDITERKRLEHELRQIASELSDANHKKDEFLATLAHELRNPLAPLRNGLQVLKLVSGDADAAEECRSMMERQLSQMVRLIDDLLDVSRISQGKITLQTEKVELSTIARQAIETSRPLIDERQHQLSVTVPHEPIHVEADVTRLAQVFSNLLNNAAKYTEPGGRISVRIERCQENAVVTVRDSGMGIPPHLLPNLFQIFMQVDRSLERSQGGLGIGLSLVKKLTEMHGGSVEARSEGQGKGCEFIVRLPIAAVPSSSQSSATNPEQARHASRRILVVDDNKDAAISLAMMLKFMGNETRTAHDGLQALDVAEEFRPEVILLDIGMPNLNGYDAARLIRQQAWSEGTFLIALTGWGQEEDRRRSQEAGFDTHLTKPADPLTIENLLAGMNADNVNSL